MDRVTLSPSFINEAIHYCLFVKLFVISKISRPPSAALKKNNNFSYIVFNDFFLTSGRKFLKNTFLNLLFSLNVYIIRTERRNKFISSITQKVQTLKTNSFICINITIIKWVNWCQWQEMKAKKCTNKSGIYICCSFMV